MDLDHTGRMVSTHFPYVNSLFYYYFKKGKIYNKGVVVVPKPLSSVDKLASRLAVKLMLTNYLCVFQVVKTPSQLHLLFICELLWCNDFILECCVFVLVAPIFHQFHESRSPLI